MKVPLIMVAFFLCVKWCSSFAALNIKKMHASTVNRTIKMSDSSNGQAIVDIKVAKKTSLLSSVINLTKNCVGAGVFSIHSRVATSTGMLPLPALGALIAIMGAWATYNFYIIGESCGLTGASTYSEAWAKAVSDKTKWIVQAVVVIAAIVSCVANVIVLTDILKLLLKSVGVPVAIWGNRNLVISLLTTIVLFPLCIQTDLSALKSVCICIEYV